MEQVSVMKNINGHFYELKSVWELEEGISKDHNRARKSQNWKQLEIGRVVIRIILCSFSTHFWWGEKMGQMYVGLKQHWFFKKVFILKQNVFEFLMGLNWLSNRIDCPTECRGFRRHFGPSPNHLSHHNKTTSTNDLWFILVLKTSSSQNSRPSQVVCTSALQTLIPDSDFSYLN